MAGRGVAAEEAQRVAVHRGAALRVDRAAFGVADARIHGQSGRLALARQLDGALGRQVPGMVEVQVRDLACQRLRIHQSRVRVLGGVAGDGAGLLDRLAHRRGRQVGRARRALALAEVHRHRQAPVALVLDRVDLAQAHAHRQALARRGVRLALRGALAPGLLQREAGDILKLRGGLSVCGCCIMRASAGCVRLKL